MNIISIVWIISLGRLSENELGIGQKDQKFTLFNVPNKEKSIEFRYEMRVFRQNNPTACECWDKMFVLNL